MPPLSTTLLEQHHVILHSALQAAQMHGVITRNVATLGMGNPHLQEEHPDVLAHGWTAEDAQRFLRMVPTTGPHW